MSEIVDIFGKTEEELLQWMEFSPDTTNGRGRQPRDPDAFLNWMLDHPETEVPFSQLMEKFLSRENPDFRFQVPQEYDEERLDQMLNHLLRAMINMELPESFSRFSRHVLMLAFKHFSENSDMDLLTAMVDTIGSADGYCFVTAVNSPFDCFAETILLKIPKGAVGRLVRGTRTTRPYPKFRQAFFKFIGTCTLEEVKNIHHHFKLTYFQGELEAATDPEVVEFLQSKLKSNTHSAATTVQQAPDLTSMLQLMPSLPKFPQFAPELACLDPKTVARDAKLAYFEQWLAAAPKRLAVFTMARHPPVDLE